jgi:hypothetical protein
VIIGDVGKLLLGHQDRHLYQLDRLLQGDRAGQLSWRGAKDLAGQTQHVIRGAQPFDERRDTRLRHQAHPRALIGRQAAEPAELVVHPCDALARDTPGGLLHAADRVFAALGFDGADIHGAHQVASFPLPGNGKPARARYGSVSFSIR